MEMGLDGHRTTVDVRIQTRTLTTNPNPTKIQSGDVRPHSHLRISMFTQHFVDVLDLTKTPLDFMLETYKDLTREDARKFLGRYGVSGDVQSQVMAQLSDGQKTRVVFAKMAKDAPHLLLLDEPTNHLGAFSLARVGAWG